MVDMLEKLSIEGFVMGEENFHEGSAEFTSIIKKKKKQWKNKYEKVFLQLEVRSSIKT